jgi:hypothetical protein
LFQLSGIHGQKGAADGVERGRLSWREIKQLVKFVAVCLSPSGDLPHAIRAA